MQLCGMVQHPLPAIRRHDAERRAGIPGTVLRCASFIAPGWKAVI